MSEKLATRGTERTANNHQFLNVVQINICGIRNKKIELAKLFQKNYIHVALIQETLHKDVDMHISGYTPYSCNCKSCRGIATYIRNDIQGNVNNVPTDTTDVQKITIWHFGSKYTVYNIYNSPSQKDCHIPMMFNVQHQKTLFAGDFNGHSPLWGYADSNKTGRMIEEACGTTNLSVLQTSESKPSFLHRGHLTLSRPDLTICSSDLQNSINCLVLDDIGSDHKPILTKIMSSSHKSNMKILKTRWNFKKANWERYRETTDRLLTNICDENNIETLNEQITTNILKAASLHIPRGCRRNYKPFWNDDIQKATEERTSCRNNLEETPNQYTRTQYRRACAKVKIITKKAKHDKWSETCKNLDLRHSGVKAWSLINNLSGKIRKTNPKPLQTDEGNIVSDQKKARRYNRYFATVNRAGKPREKDKDFKKVLKMRERCPTANISLFEDQFSICELNKAIKKLKLRKSPGPDKIHNEMICRLGKKGKEVLLNLINMTWRSGKLPKAWRNAILIPILKKNKPPSEPGSYRPISLTSCIGKLAERMINHRLYWYLESTNNICPEQAGFRAGNCTEDQIFRLVQKVHDGFQNKKHTLAVFVDLKQAYDKVWRKGLFYKMLEKGINGKLYFWIKSFLSERTIQTKINNAISSKEVLEEGLPQGSSLSCNLFLIYINDLVKEMKSEKALYADDLALWETETNIHIAAYKIKDTIKKLQEYCDNWKMEINTNKTVFTIFSKSPKVSKTKLNLEIDNERIKLDPNPTYLGIQLDQQLNLNKHVENITSKGTKRLNLLKRLSSTNWGSDKQTLRNLYLGYVRPVLEYNNSILTSCSNSTIRKVDKIQNNALRFICGGMKSSPVAACEIYANVEPLDLRREKAVFEIVEKCKRMEQDHPNRQLVETWKPNRRIKLKSPLDSVKAMGDKYQLPKQRKEILRISLDPPNNNLLEPTIVRELCDKSTKSSADVVTLKTSSENTIDKYPNQWIHVYTDGSAVKATTKAGYGCYIQYPNGMSEDLYGACGEKCSNYEAEAIAIETALYHLNTIFDTTPSKKTDVVIFTDAMSVLQALECQDYRGLEQIHREANDILKHDIKLVMQWIPGHVNTPGNDKADCLAKRGSKQTQPNRKITLQTAKQILKTNSKEDWMNRWALGKTGRSLFKHMTTPTRKDNLDGLNRKEQITIFRLRTQHIPLNMHLNRINPEHPPMCPLCNHPYETVNHHLFECSMLSDIRALLLPQQPDTWNTLYGTTKQLQQTCIYHYMALGRRTDVYVPLDQ